MIMHFLLVTVLFLEIFLGYNTQVSAFCQENEEYSECGSPCELNCTNLNTNIFCTKPCHRGCFCKPDFVRDSRNKCVDPRNCRIAECSANEEYVRCVNFCNTCSVSEYCQTPYCTPGCDCKPGYFRNTYGQCVTEEQCITDKYALQEQCGINEVYTSCVNPCNDCDSRGRCNDYLFKYCSPGCDCKPEYFRNDDGICIPEWNCLRESQPLCLPGEEYYNCIPTCKVTCDTYNSADVICDTTCNRGCFCKRGLVRRADGLCIPPSECPARPLPCPQGEILYHCLPTCRTTCRTFNSPSGLCSTECRQGCFCQPGFVRNDNGICVPPSECPSVCGPNKEFRTCGSACPATCENFRERRICSQQRCLRGCYCKASFVLGPSGICIRPRNCPVYKPTPCCGGLQGRKGNETDDEDTTSMESITTTPVTTEMSSNDSSNASSSAATKSPQTSTKVPDKTTLPKTIATTTTPKSVVATTTSKSETVTTTPKLMAATTTPNPVAVTTNLKSVVVTTTPKSVVVTTTPKSLTVTTTPKSMIVTTTPKSVTVITTPKSVAVTTTPKLAAGATKAEQTIIFIENKTEPIKLTTNAADTPAANVKEEQTNNTELNTSTDLTNSSTTNFTIKP